MDEDKNKEGNIELIEEGHPKERNSKIIRLESKLRRTKILLKLSAIVMIMLLVVIVFGYYKYNKIILELRNKNKKILDDIQLSSSSKGSNLVCPECLSSIAIEKINTTGIDYEMSYTCKNKHKKEDVSLFSYLKQVENLKEEGKNICNEHNKNYIGYCPICNKELCTECMESHKEHSEEIVKYEDVLEMDKMKSYVDKKGEQLKQLEDVNKMIHEWLDRLKERIETMYSNERHLINLERNYVSGFDVKEVNNEKIKTLNYLLNSDERFRVPQGIEELSWLEKGIIQYLKSNQYNFFSIFNEDANKIVIAKFPEFDSKLAGSFTDMKFLLDSLPREPKKIIKLYSAKENNCSAKKFHELCDDKGPTLVIIRSKKYFTFGGYTEQSWGGTPGIKEDKNAFLFNLNTKTKEMSRDNIAMRAWHNNGPRFGTGSTIYISNNCFDNDNSYTSVRPSYGNIQLQEFTTMEDERFIVDEYEVFQVIY